MHTPIMDLITSPLLLQENNFAMFWRARRRAGNAPRGIMQDQHGLTAEHRQKYAAFKDAGPCSLPRVLFGDNISMGCRENVVTQYEVAAGGGQDVLHVTSTMRIHSIDAVPKDSSTTTPSAERTTSWAKLDPHGGAPTRRRKPSTSSGSSKRNVDNNSTVRCRSLLPKPPTERNLQHLAGNMEDAERQRGARKVRRSTHFTITEFNEATSCAVSISQTRANIADGRNRSILPHQAQCCMIPSYSRPEEVASDAPPVGSRRGFYWHARSKDRGPRNKEQGTRNKEQQTNKQGTRIKEQGSRNPKQSTSNKQQATRNKEQGTWNKEQGTRNKEQGTSNKEQGTHNTGTREQ